jgi:hypothetical protein
MPRAPCPDLQGVIGQRPLKRLTLIPRRTHLDIAPLVSGEDQIGVGGEQSVMPGFVKPSLATSGDVLSKVCQGRSGWQVETLADSKLAIAKMYCYEVSCQNRDSCFWKTGESGRILKRWTIFSRGCWHQTSSSWAVSGQLTGLIGAPQI